MLTAEQHAKPHQVDAEFMRDRRQQRHDDEAEFERNPKRTPRRKPCRLTTIKKPSAPPGKLVSNCSTHKSPFTRETPG